MATHVSTPTILRPIVHIRFTWISRVRDAISNRLPRRRTVVTLALIVGGMCVPMLMVVGLIPASFPLAFLGLALTATGGVLALVFCGEL